MNWKSPALALAVVLLAAPPLPAAPAHQIIPISFKAALAPGSYTFTFKLYTEKEGGTLVWSEQPAGQLSVPSDGIVKHNLGSVNPFANGTAGPVDFTEQLWAAPSGGGKNFTRFRLPLSAFSLATSGLRVVEHPNGQNLIVGGPDNTAADGTWAAMVGGGRQNDTGGSFAAVLGGSSNSAGGEHATVAGGQDNAATGSHAMVAGGCTNVADGYASFAAGEDARASGIGTFVWSASDDAWGGIYEESGFPAATVGGNPNPLLGDGQFWAKAPGGVFFVSGKDVDGQPLGVMLPAGAQAWEPISLPVSDVNLKRDFAGVDGRTVLERLAAVPVSTWSYRADAAGTRHIGPMAQDFAAAFGLGKDDRHIDPIDATGVSLAAVQGLHQLVRELQEQVGAQGRELAAERARTAALLARVDELALRLAQVRQLLAGTSGSGDLAAK